MVEMDTPYEKYDVRLMFRINLVVIDKVLFVDDV